MRAIHKLYMLTRYRCASLENAVESSTHPANRCASLENAVESSPPPASLADKRFQQRISRLGTHAPAEIDAIVTASSSLKQKLKERPAPFIYAAHTVVLSLYGFSPVMQRNCLLWSLKSTLNPKLLYASNTGAAQWEAMIVMTLRESTLSNHYQGLTETPVLANGKLGSPEDICRVDAFINEVQAFCDLFKLSASILDLVSFQNPSAVSCLHRIEQGTFTFGNLWTAPNRWLLSSYQANLRRMQQDSENENVRLTTGMDYTTGNFMANYYAMRNAQLELHRLRVAHSDIMQHLQIFEGMIQVQARIWSEAIPAYSTHHIDAQARISDETIRGHGTNHANHTSPVRISAPLPSPPASQLQDPARQPAINHTQPASQLQDPARQPAINHTQPSSASMTAPQNAMLSMQPWTTPTYHFIQNNTVMLHELNHMRHLLHIDNNLVNTPDVINLVTPGASPSPPMTPPYASRTPPPQLPTNQLSPPNFLVVRRILQRSHSVPPIQVD